MNSRQYINDRLLHTLRVVLGMLFVFSGFVKCIDTTGGAIKIEDYFVAWGMDGIPFGVCMGLSLVQNVAEMTVGYLLICNVFVSLSSLVALLFMAFFTPLTLYIAIADPVSDCGCFGDAVKLSNWQTFYKNLLFLPIAVVVYWKRERFRQLIVTWRKCAIAIVGIAASVIISVKGITDEPIIDFRPYSVGTDIAEAMAIPEDAPMPEYQTTFILSKNGEEKEFDENNYPYNDSTWTFIDSKSVVISEGYVPPIKDFTLIDREGENKTNEILASAEPVYLFVSPMLDKVSDEHVKTVKKVVESQFAKGRQTYILTASGEAQQAKFNERAETGFDYLMGDETMLKTIVRSNPGLIVIQNGVIVAKYHPDHLPAHGIDNPLATYLTNISAENVRLIILCIIFAVGLLLTTLYKKQRSQNKNTKQ